LELIGLYNNPIRLLEVWDDDGTKINVKPFEALNLSLLSEIRLFAQGCKNLDQIFDLISKSSCNQFSLFSEIALDERGNRHPVVSHKLMQRVVTLHLQFGKQLKVIFIKAKSKTPSGLK
jgi:hypothetical protein